MTSFFCRNTNNGTGITVTTFQWVCVHSLSCLSRLPSTLKPPSSKQGRSPGTVGDGGGEEELVELEVGQGREGHRRGAQP